MGTGQQKTLYVAGQDAGLWDRIEAYARAQDRSLSFMITWLIREFLAGQDAMTSEDEPQ
jgi:hypothetical protein